MQMTGAMTTWSDTNTMTEITNSRFGLAGGSLICWNVSNSSNRPIPVVAATTKRSMRLMLTGIRKYSVTAPPRYATTGRRRAGISHRKTLRMVIAGFPQ